MSDYGRRVGWERNDTSIATARLIGFFQDADDGSSGPCALVERPDLSVERVYIGYKSTFRFIDPPAPSSPAATPEPPPKPGQGDVWAEIIDHPCSDAFKSEARARRQFGIDKYATPLQRDNGRDNPNDMRQEGLDMLAYAWADDPVGPLAILIAKVTGVTMLPTREERAVEAERLLNLVESGGI